jgi:hypothetical protein
MRMQRKFKKLEGEYKVNEDKKTMYLYISIVVLVLACGYLLCSLYHNDYDGGTARSLERDISGAQQSQQSAINRLDGITTELGATASEVGGISDSIGSSATEIGDTAERIGTDQARVDASARLIAEGQGILRDIQESNQQENKPTKD